MSNFSSTTRFFRKKVRYVDSLNGSMKIVVILETQTTNEAIMQDMVCFSPSADDWIGADIVSNHKYSYRTSQPESSRRSEELAQHTIASDSPDPIDAESQLWITRHNRCRDSYNLFQAMTLYVFRVLVSSLLRVVTRQVKARAKGYGNFDGHWVHSF